MNRIRKFLVFLPALCLALWSAGIRCHAAEEYTYTVTFYPGNHGTFAGTGGVSIGGGNASNVSIGMEGEAIKVRGLKSGDMVSLDAALSGTVVLGEDSRYYVKGIRLSGRDNNTVDSSAFRVEGDRDYVVAYGIRGDMTSYVVNYQDEAGNALGESRSYYGNVGDKPVVAFLYVEGYEPMAYNLTKTLVSNEAENVFTFIYRRAADDGGGNEPGGDSTAGDAGSGDTVPSGPGNGGLAGDAEAGADGAAGGIGGIGNDAGNGGAAVGENADAGIADNGVNGNNEANGGQAGAGGIGGENVELGDEEVPLDLMELDDEEVPLADNALEGMPGMEEGSRIFAASAILVAASVGVLILFAFWVKRNSKETT